MRKLTIVIGLLLLAVSSLAVDTKGLRMGWRKARRVAATGGGTVTSVGSGWAITATPDPITATGTIAVDSATIRAWLGTLGTIDSVFLSWGLKTSAADSWLRGDSTAWLDTALLDARYMGAGSNPTDTNAFHHDAAADTAYDLHADTVNLRYVKDEDGSRIIWLAESTKYAEHDTTILCLNDSGGCIRWVSNGATDTTWLEFHSGRSMTGADSLPNLKLSNNNTTARMNPRELAIDNVSCARLTSAGDRSTFDSLTSRKVYINSDNNQESLAMTKHYIDNMTAANAAQLQTLDTTAIFSRSLPLHGKADSAVLADSVINLPDSISGTAVQTTTARFTNSFTSGLARGDSGMLRVDSVLAVGSGTHNDQKLIEFNVGDPGAGQPQLRYQERFIAVAQNDAVELTFPGTEASAFGVYDSTKGATLYTHTGLTDTARFELAHDDNYSNATNYRSHALVGGGTVDSFALHGFYNYQGTRAEWITVNVSPGAANVKDVTFPETLIVTRAAYRGSAIADSMLVTAYTAATLYGPPPGQVIDWYGDSTAWPSGYVLCNGTLKYKNANGDSVVTPDLRNLFVVGANGDSSGVPTSTISGVEHQAGGSTSYTPAGNITAHSLAGAGSDFVSTAADNAYADHAFTGSAATIIPPYRALWKLIRSRTW